MRMPPLFMNATGFYSSCKCLHFQIQQYNYQHFNGIEQAFYDTWEFLVTYVNKDIIANQNKFEFTKRLYNLQDYFWWLFSPTRKYFIIHQEFSSTHWYYKSRSWFGLITQVSLAYYISPTMKPFKDLLKPNIKFYWDHHLDTLLHQSNYHITAAVKDVIKTFDPKRNLFTNWLELWWYRLSPPSETFDCTAKQISTCCPDCWNIVCAGSSSKHLLKAATHQLRKRPSPWCGLWNILECLLKDTPILSCQLTIHHFLQIFNNWDFNSIQNPHLQSMKGNTFGWSFPIV